MKQELSIGTKIGGLGLILSYVFITIIFIASIRNYNHPFVNFSDLEATKIISYSLLPEYRRYSYYISKGIFDNRMGNSLAIMSFSIFSYISAIFFTFLLKINKDTINIFDSPPRVLKLIFGSGFLILIYFLASPFGDENCSSRTAVNISCQNSNYIYPLFVIYLKLLMMNTIISALTLCIKTKIVTIIEIT